MGSSLSCEKNNFDTTVFKETYQRGLIHYVKKEYDESFKILVAFVDEEGASEEHILCAVYKIRSMIEDQCISKDTIKWIIQTSDSRDEYTMVDAVLSRMCFYGYGVIQNIRKSIELERRGIRHNVPHCQSNLDNILQSRAYTVEDHIRLEDRYHMLQLKYMIREILYPEELTEIIMSYNNL